jgi:orotidine-5'-phosphate decarboxylase
MMFVVGATHPDAFARVRELVPEHFLLVPGVGAQETWQPPAGTASTRKPAS